MKRNLSLSIACPAQVVGWKLCIQMGSSSCGSRALGHLHRTHGCWDGQTRGCAGGGEAVITGLFRTVVRSWDPLLHPNLILGSATY